MGFRLQDCAEHERARERGATGLAGGDRAADYVRESYVMRSRRSGKPGWRGEGRLVGYAELRPDAPGIGPQAFERRVFWLKDQDRDTSPDGPYATGTPAEAVDPRTVAVGQAGRSA